MDQMDRLSEESKSREVWYLALRSLLFTADHRIAMYTERSCCKILDKARLITPVFPTVRILFLIKAV